MKLTEKEMGLLKAKVESLEKDTSGEVIPLVVERSSPNGALPDWWTSVILLLTITGIWLYEKSIDFPIALDPVLFGLSIFIVILTVVLHLNVVERFLIGRGALTRFAEDRALVEFMRQGLSNTRDRTGVLVFISLFEHKLEILADRGIADKVSNDEWKQIADRSALLLKKGHLYEALSLTLDEIGPHLKKHFPRSIGDGDTNELSDEVRVRK